MVQAFTSPKLSAILGTIGNDGVTLSPPPPPSLHCLLYSRRCTTLNGCTNYCRSQWLGICQVPPSCLLAFPGYLVHFATRGTRLKHSTNQSNMCDVELFGMVSCKGIITAASSTGLFLYHSRWLEIRSSTAARENKKEIKNSMNPNTPNTKTCTFHSNYLNRV